MPPPRAMFRILSVTCLLTRKALRLINYYSRLAHMLNVERFYIRIIIYVCASTLRIIFIIIIVIVVVPRVGVYLFVVFCHHVHLAPEL